MARPAAAAVLLLGGGLLWIAPVAGSSQDQPQFRGGVNLIQLDVSVLDRSRHVVKGLQASDFTVTIDGVPSPVEAFSEVELPAPLDAPELPGSLGLDVVSNRLDAKRVVSIAINDRLPRGDERALGQIQALAHGIIAKLGPADIGSVSYFYHSDLGQTLTADKGLLERAIDRMTPLSPIAIERMPTFVLDPLTNLIDALGQSGSRRKVVFILGVGAPRSVSSSLVPGDLTERDNLYRAARRAGVVINCLSVELGNEESCAEVAINTNGEYVTDTNTPLDDVPGIFDQNGSYYLLGVRPVATKGPGRIDVKVGRSGATAWTRAQVADSPSGPLTTRQAMAASTASPIPDSRIPLQLASIPFADPLGTSAHVVLLLSEVLPGIKWTSADVQEVTIQVSDADGREEHGGAETVRWAKRPAAPGDRQGTVLAIVDLPWGRHQIRASVHSTVMNATGSIFGDVEIPDYSHTPVALSGITVTTSVPQVQVGTAAAVQFTQSVPTIARTFSSSEHVTLSAWVYQMRATALKDVDAEIYIDNASGQVFRAARHVGADEFDRAGRKFLAFDVPLDHLSGAYVATIAAGGTDTRAEQSVRLSVH